MPELPFPRMLDRADAAKGVARDYGDQLELLTQLTNFGARLVLRAFHSSEKTLGDLIVCCVLLKHVVAMLDATETLIRSGAIHCAHVSARAAFEASVYVEWLLVSDKEKKAQYYYVSNIRHDRMWSKRAIKGTPESQAFTDVLQGLEYDMHARRPTIAEEASKHLAQVERILAQKPFAAIDEAFGKKKREPKWYAPLGVGSLRDIAKTLNRLAEYDLFYAMGSNVTHAASYKDHIRFKAKGQVHIKTIRRPEGIKALLHFTLQLAVRTYRMVITYYRPGEVASFTRTYINEWRGAFLDIPDIEYKFD